MQIVKYFQSKSKLKRIAETLETFLIFPITKVMILCVMVLVTMVWLLILMASLLYMILIVRPKKI